MIENYGYEMQERDGMYYLEGVKDVFIPLEQTILMKNSFRQLWVQQANKQH